MTTTTPLGSDARAWAAENLRGFYMCPVTPPLTDEFELDEEGLRQNIDAFVEMGGCTGLVVGGFFRRGMEHDAGRMAALPRGSRRCHRRPPALVHDHSGPFGVPGDRKKCGSWSPWASPAPRS